jgi:hypothetical protein
MKRKLLFGSLIGLAGVAGVKKLRRAKRTPVDKLQNAQGVGPAHVHGVLRGEERMAKNGSNEVNSVAGRIAGSIHPQSHGPGGSRGKRLSLRRRHRASARLASVSKLPLAPVDALSGGPGGSEKWASSFAQ